MPYPAYTVLPSFRPTQDRQAQRRRAGYQARHQYSCRVAPVALPVLGFVRPVIDIPTCATETAGAGGLKIAETFPEGRGSPHGCGLRAVFCTDAASARPEACRDKSKGPRSGDFAGRSPGVQGAAATGRPLCAPCGIRDITQKINRERNLPGINIEVVALLSVARAGKLPDGGAWRLIRATKASKPRLNLRRRGPLTPARG
ncbi:Uncharacterised protein [Klebsiella variicola]|uniref:Uncharacterized protein n=1 Tax=Klebsiella variicola TaxID=244366 RepID=A0ABD7PD57_KLEVA|nr:hypothetical protein B8O08_11700 [Klebsiella variicola]PXH34231.1 hypothetical protein DMR27_26095 [Klebsiella variicola]QAA70424.1 hypothetical protein D4N21_02410 [Klebsiella variicola]SXE70971.1 Uncharacterised protein [Klebsiella variicola]SXF98444.1 Uncharacterised protein [Klebsiella variicola]